MENKKLIVEEKIDKKDLMNSAMSENGVVDLLNGNLVVVREQIFDRNKQPMTSEKGRLLYTYSIYCKIKDRDMRINVLPKAQDVGAYELLDLIFSISEKAELVVGEESMTDDNGRVTYYPTYTIHVREDNIDYDCSVRLPRPSDRSLYSTLMSILRNKGILQ